MSVAKKQIIARLLALSLFSSLPVNPAAAPSKDVRVYTNVVPFITDGGIPGGPCMRISGDITAPDFFTGLARVSTPDGFEYRRGKELVTEFPQELTLHLQIRDIPCMGSFEAGAPRRFLTQQIVGALAVRFYWKRGFALRPLKNVTRTKATALQLSPIANMDTGDPVDRYLWRFEFAVPSAGVPLTDHLVIVLRTAEGKLVARVSARL
jgi:hypothetical protein